MNKWVLYILLVFFSLSLHAKTNTPSIKISGIKGGVLRNVDKRLSELQQLKPLSQLTEDEIRYQIINAMQPYGYFKAQVLIHKTSSKLSVQINPGSQLIISKIYLALDGDGARAPALLRVLDEIPLKERTFFSTISYNKAKQSLVNTAENLGYLHGNFKKAEILIDEPTNTANITLVFDTGPLYYFGQVRFDPTYIAPELLSRYIPFKYGQPYSTDKILEFNNNLSSSGYFNSVLVKPKIGQAQKVPVRVHLQPVSKYSYTLGIGYGTDTGPRGRAALHVIPVNRWGHKFNAIALGSFTQNALQAQYSIPGRNPVTDQYTITGNYSNLNYDSGYSNSMLLSLAQQHNLDEYQRSLSINGLYESFHYTLQPNTEQLLLYPKATFTYKNTKDKLFSPNGYNVTFNVLGADKFLLSEINFAQASIDAKAAVTIDPLKLRVFGHIIQGITATKDINQLPLSLALLLGGTDNLKAYSFNSIGPGKIISYAGIELQKETFKDWYLLGFYDVGDVYDPIAKSIEYDVGAGLMWVSPIGPIKAGLAQAVNNRFQRIEGTSPRIIISLGPDL